MTQEERELEGGSGLPPRREPIFNIPGVLSAYVATMIVVELVRSYVLSSATDQWLVSVGAFKPARYVDPIAQQSALEYFLGPVTYSFLHGGWAHLGSNALFLVVFATPLAARIGAFRFTVLWITSAVASAFFLAVLTGFEPSVLIGASGVVSATVGASCRSAMPLLGSNRVTAARYAPRLGMIEAVGHRSVLAFVASWLLFNVVIAGVDPSSNVAWQAHLGGFLFGYLSFGFFDPPLRH